MTILVLLSNAMPQPDPYSSAAASRNVVSSRDREVILIEINHADLPTPLRFVRDNQDITSNGTLYVAMGFDITLPTDLSEGLPRARLAVDNVGREMTVWIEASGGGQGATCRIMQVLRSAPDILEADITMDLSSVVMTQETISAALGFEDTLNKPAVTLSYRPDTAQGLF